MMKSTHAISAIVVFTAVLSGCIRSVYSVDRSVAFNGGFEVAESGMPVNWFFEKRSVRNGTMEISLDTSDVVEGRHSLKVVVHDVEYLNERWIAPWLFSGRSVRPSSTCKVSFWLKNQGSVIKLVIRNEGKDPLFGLSEAEKRDYDEHPPITKTIGVSETGTNQWRLFEYDYPFPATDDTIRFEINVVRPGSFWIDDVRIEEVHAGSSHSDEVRRRRPRSPF